MKTSRFVVISFSLAVAAATLAAFAADAGANWTEHCAKCHGPDGKGQTKMGKKLGLRDLSDGAVQAKFSDAEAFKAMKEGVKDKDGKQTMKPAEGLSDADLQALVAHVRTLKK